MLCEALEKSLGTMTFEDKDLAAVELARSYANQLENGADFSKVGPRYLDCLESLGMTPKARAALTGKEGVPSGPAVNPLDELRQRRAARQH
jgi:hypothetical protein